MSFVDVEILRLFVIRLKSSCRSICTRAEFYVLFFVTNLLDDVGTEDFQIFFLELSTTCIALLTSYHLIMFLNLSFKPMYLS